MDDANLSHVLELRYAGVAYLMIVSDRNPATRAPVGRGAFGSLDLQRFGAFVFTGSSCCSLLP